MEDCDFVCLLSKKNKLGNTVICFDVEVDLRMLHCCVCTLNLKQWIWNILTISLRPTTLPVLCVMFEVAVIEL